MESRKGMKVSKLILVIICLIFIHYSVSAQSKVDCEQLLKKEISIQDINENGEEFLNNFKILIGCEFEEIDFEIFMGTLGSLPMMVGPLFGISEGSNRQSKYTYQDLKKSLESLKKEPEYLKIRGFIETRNLIFEREAYISNWESDAKLIKQLDASEELLLNIHSIVKSNEGKKYSEIFQMYLDFLVTENQRMQLERERISTQYKLKNPGTEILVEGLYAYKTFEDGLKKSKDANKPLLLYFNGYACVNARKMEEFILTEPDIQEYIRENFVLVNLLVDDKKKLEDGQMYYSEVLSRNITTIGQKNSEFQIRQFRANDQPLFVIVGTDEKEVSRIGYVTEESKFTEFLKNK